MMLRSDFLQQTFNTAINFLYPTQCRICEDQIGLYAVPYLCKVCWDRIDFVKPPFCEICGIPDIDGTCAECETNPPRYGKLRTIALYKDALQQAIHLFKFEKRPNIAKYLIQLIIDNTPSDCNMTEYDYIIPIPIHKVRLNERGFNQCIILSKGIAENCRVDVRTDVLIRRRNTSPQSSLDREKRLKNIIGAFGLEKREHLQGKKILVFDDVYTTGTTVREAVNVLWEADPTEIDVLTLARTPIVQL